MTLTARPSLRSLLDGRFVVAVLAVWTLLRAFTTVLLVYLAEHHQDPVVYADDPQLPRYLEVATLWDGAWYQRIAEQGYPDHLPVGPTGEVKQNPWAFYPIFPMLARGLTLVTGWPFEVTGVIVATVLGYAAALVVAGLLREKVGRVAALGGVAVLGAYPAAPTFQVAYTEPLALLLLAAVLWLLVRERWAWAGAAALLTGLARPIALPLGLVALVTVLLRLRQRHTSGQPITPGLLARMGTALVGCGLAGLVWPAIAWWGTGERDAYTLTMSAWRRGEKVTPFVPTIERVQWLWGDVTGLVLLVAGLALLCVAVLGPWARRLGVEMRTWCLGYVLYLFAALDPWTSIFRYLMLLFPLFVLMVGGGWRPEDRSGGERPAWVVLARTAALVGVCLALQVWWTYELFLFVPPTDDPP